MTPNYARLCGVYATARALTHGSVEISHYTPESIANTTIQELANRVQMLIDENPDPNALTPVSVTINLKHDRSVSTSREFVLGNPKNPLSHPDHLAKLRKNCASSQPRIPNSQVEALIKRTNNLEREHDVATLVDLLIA